MKGKLGQIDGFAASVVTIDPKGFDRSGNGNVIAGRTSRLSPPLRSRRSSRISSGFGQDGVRAWAGHGVVGKTLSGVRGSPRMFGEYNYASGDADATDGTRGTFDQLYPTGHDKLGLLDQVGWKNTTPGPASRSGRLPNG